MCTLYLYPFCKNCRIISGVWKCIILNTVYRYAPLIKTYKQSMFSAVHWLLSVASTFTPVFVVRYITTSRLPFLQ